jgi:uncharacterized membrane protein YcfT
VVVFHSVIFLAAADSSWRWEGIVYSFETLRMPLFFCAAGLFSIKVTRQTLPQLWRSRLALLSYLYVLWSVTRWIFFQFVPFVLPGTDAGDWRALVSILWWPTGGLWFLYALIIYAVFLWACRRLPAWLPIGISVAISILFSSGVIFVSNDAWMKVGSYIAFFVVPAYSRDLFLRTAARLTLPLCGGLIVAYGGLALAYQVLALSTFFGARLVVSVAGVAAGMALSVVLSGLSWANWLSWLGRRTLPIYLVHYFPIAGFAAALVVSGTVLPGALAAIAVPVIAAASIGLSLVFNGMFGRVPGVVSLPQRRGVPALRGGRGRSSAERGPASS